jgi:hypothetical protein
MLPGTAPNARDLDTTEARAIADYPPTARIFIFGKREF